MAKKNFNVKAVDASGKVRVYDSIAEASRALHLDASNIAKVLRKNRKSAGGYGFSYTLEAPTTAAGKAARRTRREAAEHKEIVTAVHDRLKELNQRFRNAMKEKVFNKDQVLKKLMSHTDYFGATKTGGYNITLKNLNAFSNDELENLLKVLRSEEKKYVKIAERKKRPRDAATTAAILGITEEQVKNYDAIIPAVFDLIRLAKEDKFFKYSEVQTAIFEALQRDEDEETIERYVDTIYDAYSGNDQDALSDILEEINQVEEEYRDRY